ncbi:MAG TPA: DsbE family thiol:disulfide interchange protein [Sedimenticola thiotaurini]|uniref:DsbE family thiol:disulfide interchange protein n=1 Tax=Sedimenticola thiotaurini TaxID=1543721 RepID=A0A831RN33_9GAMM|nr:DsbE family thiol:disulfide interchange protein [Sedimenticola thiotaurini]
MDSLAQNGSRSGRRWKPATLIPLGIFLVMVVFLGIGLTMDPKLVPSPLIGKSVPEFSLPPVKGRTLGLKTEDLKGQVSMVNVFASWCVACRQEHPLLLALSRQDVVPIHGLNYKDQPDDAAAWLDELGDPYTRTGADRDGMVGIDWGVYGVPETFIIDKQGTIAYKHIGPIRPKDWEETLLPLINRLQKQQPSPFPEAGE